MTLESRLTNLAQAVGADVKAAKSRLASLEANAPVRVQASAPSIVGPYVWFQTDYLGAGGLTLWIEDGVV